MTNDNTDTIEITARHFGTISESGQIPRKLSDLITALQDIRDRIPAPYQDSAVVDCEPDYEFGESYASMRITFVRPETPEETDKRLNRDVQHWVSQLEEARERVKYCEKRIDAD